MITPWRKFGDAGETRAVEYLEAKGYKLLERNWTASHHEVDIIMQDGAWLVLVEVKTRTSDTFADPMRAITSEKIWNLLEAAKAYRHTHPETYSLLVRIDAVCIVGRDLAQIEHYIDPYRRRIMNRTPYRDHYRKVRKPTSW